MFSNQQTTTAAALIYLILTSFVRQFPLLHLQCYLLSGCRTSRTTQCVSQGHFCTDKFACCHTETEVADQACYLTQSHRALTLGQPILVLTLWCQAPSRADTQVPVSISEWYDSTIGESWVRFPHLLLSRQMPKHKATKVVIYNVLHHRTRKCSQCPRPLCSVWKRFRQVTHITISLHERSPLNDWLLANPASTDKSDYGMHSFNFCDGPPPVSSVG